MSFIYDGVETTKTLPHVADELIVEHHGGRVGAYAEAGIELEGDDSVVGLAFRSQTQVRKQAAQDGLRAEDVAGGPPAELDLVAVGLGEAKVGVEGRDTPDGVCGSGVSPSNFGNGLWTKRRRPQDLHFRGYGRHRRCGD